MKLRRGGYGSGEWAYSKVLKLRVMQSTFDKLVELQQSRGLCMAQLLRELVYRSLEKEFTEK